MLVKRADPKEALSRESGRWAVGGGESDEVGRKIPREYRTGIKVPFRRP
jgi:hypothetical protein